MLVALICAVLTFNFSFYGGNVQVGANGHVYMYLKAAPSLGFGKDSASAGSVVILIVTVIWQFTGIWNEFLFGVVFTGGTQQPITAALVALSASQQSAHAYDVASAAVIIGAIPPLLIYLFGGKYFVRGLTQGAIK